MGYESIAHEAEGRMGYWLKAHEGKRNNCFTKIKLVRQKEMDPDWKNLPHNYKTRAVFMRSKKWVEETNKRGVAWSKQILQNHEWKQTQIVP